MITFVDFGLIAKALSTLTLIGLARFFYRLYKVRSQVREASRKYGVPMLPHSFFWGHLLVVGKFMAKYPEDLFGQYLPYLLAQEHPDLAACGLIYIDAWPFTAPMLAVFHPEMMAQFTQQLSLPKHSTLKPEFAPFTQGHDLLTMEGQEWKMWRSIFNPGFSAKNLTALLPSFLEEVQVLRDQLISVAKSGQVVKLEEHMQKGTIDVICRAALGIRLHCQTKDNAFYKAMRTAISWLVIDNGPRSIIKYWNPYRVFTLWNCNRIIKNFIKPHVERGIAEFVSSSANSSGFSPTVPKTINFLAIKSYLQSAKSDSNSPPRIDSKFIDVVIAQLKIFIFAGHETTASALSFAYHLLSSNPRTLRALREEHDSVLGMNVMDAHDRISAEPQLLNQLPYTSAVIKETLRLFPPAGTVRQGQEGFFLTHPDTGKQYPTQGCMVFGCSFAVHRLEAFWARPTEFLPERWLAREGEPLHVRKNAFRPFELGPRNCIGQELSQIEIRMILAMTAREFEFESAYPPDAPEVLGEKAYQVLLPGDVTGHVKGGYPVRIKLRTG